MAAEDRIITNRRRYAETYLQYYRRVLASELHDAHLEARSWEGYSRLIAGRLDQDFCLHVVFEPFATWIVFSTVCPGQCITVADAKLDRDWQLLVPHDAKERQILEYLGIPRDTVITIDRFARPEFFVNGREDEIDEIAKRYAVVQAQGDAMRVPRWIAETARNAEWTATARSVREAMDAAGTQAAGIQFQRELSRVLEMAGCEPRDVNIKGQQIDASCWIAGHPMLIEMLNSGVSADAAEVRDLFGKLMSRPAGVIGVLCAPGGFTKGAVADVERLANERSILLWGRAEIDRLLLSPNEVSTFFLECYRNFIDRAGAQK